MKIVVETYENGILAASLVDDKNQVVSRITSPTSTECKPEAPHPGARFPGGAQPNQKEISHAGKI
jgi:hypothetical protein